MVIALLRWWYGLGWIQAFARISSKAQGTMRAFSAPILLRTLFSPWRRIVSAPGKSIDAKFRAVLDNLVSRVVGVVSRSLVLLTAIISTLFVSVFWALVAIVWPLLPIAMLYCLVRVFV